eukprot:scaffold227_cov165-Amphora_coffeaeformis.AAC.38
MSGFRFENRTDCRNIATTTDDACGTGFIVRSGLPQWRHGGGDVINNTKCKMLWNGTIVVIWKGASPPKHQSSIKKEREGQGSCSVGLSFLAGEHAQRFKLYENFSRLHWKNTPHHTYNNMRTEDLLAETDVDMTEANQVKKKKDTPTSQNRVPKRELTLQYHIMVQ